MKTNVLLFLTILIAVACGSNKEAHLEKLKSKGKIRRIGSDISGYWEVVSDKNYTEWKRTSMEEKAVDQLNEETIRYRKGKNSP